LLAKAHNLSPSSSVSTREDDLARRLTSRQLGMIALGGAIGTGLFLSSNIAVRLARPGAYRDDAYRFLDGTPHIPALYAAAPGLNIIRQVGVERIRERSLELTRNLIERAREHGWRVHTPEADHERGGTVTLDIPRGPEVLQEFLRRDVLVDYRLRAGLRAPPHFYNTEEEIDRLLAEIASLLASS
jgi:selenocysteine lyase/cysteine desulfurase